MVKARDSAVLRVWRHRSFSSSSSSSSSSIRFQHGVRRRWGSSGAILTDTSAPFSVTAFQTGPAGEEVKEEEEEEEEG